MDSKNLNGNDQKARERREFLKKSLYAAYATPVIMSLLVEKASAAKSWDPGNSYPDIPPPPPRVP